MRRCSVKVACVVVTPGWLLVSVGGSAREPRPMRAEYLLRVGIKSTLNNMRKTWNITKHHKTRSAVRTTVSRHVEYLMFLGESHGQSWLCRPLSVKKNNQSDPRHPSSARSFLMSC